MRLSDDDTQVVYNYVAAVRRSHQEHGWPIPYALQRVFGLLDLNVRLMARGGHEFEGDGKESDPWISTQEAADILELSSRQTRRLKADLEGEEPNGRLMFRTSKVRAYAEGRRNGRAQPAD